VSEVARRVHFDCFSGAAGNMLLGALLAADAPARAVRAAIDALGVPGLRMRVSSVRRGPIAATYVSFRSSGRGPRERNLAEIRRLLRKAKLAPRIKARSQAAFERLAAAEGRIHRRPPQSVHFHEVGSDDAIGDVVGVCAALEALGADRVTASPLPLGNGGSVSSAHGRLPLPAPATVELLRGVPTYPAEVRWETVTPTGAALLVALSDGFGPMPALVPLAQGFGAGDDREGPLPNVLRAVVGEAEAGMQSDTVSVIETHLDDMEPEALPFLLERLMEDGALDASLLSLSMKKGRPGQLLRVLARPADRDRLARRILLESSAIGVRFADMARLKLERSERKVQTPYGRIRVKLSRAPDGAREVSPEYEDCARAARRCAVPLRRVYRAAEQAALRERL
jgi:hypothetical protein